MWPNYLFLGFTIVVVSLFFFMKTKVALLIFLVFSISIQYLERVHIGILSGLDLVGIVLPILFLSSIILRQYNLDRLDIIFLAFLILTIPAALTNTETLSLLERFGCWAKFLNGLVVMMAIKQNVKSFEDIKKLINAILIAAIPMCLIATYQLMHLQKIHFMMSSKQNNIDAFFHHRGLLAFALVTIFPLLLFRSSQSISKKKFLWYICILLFTILLYFTYLRVAWIGLAVEVLVWNILRKNGRLLIGLAIALILILLLTPIGNNIKGALEDIPLFFSHLRQGILTNPTYDDLFTGRWGIFMVNINAFFSQGAVQMFIGNGIGSTIFFYSQATGISIGHHNNYLILLLDMGLIGFILYISMIIMLFRIGWRLVKVGESWIRIYSISYLSFLISYILMGLGNHLFYHLTTGIWIFWILAGVTIALSTDAEIQI